MSDKLRILIVDDDRRMARTLLDILKVKGYEANVAHSGPEALEKVAEAHFDCLLSDINMPKVNGVELYQAIKERRPDLPVVLMTAYSHDKLVNEGLKEGAIAVITKPLDINTLLSFFSALQKEQSIVIVDDDSPFSKTLADILRSRGFTVTQVTDPKDITEPLERDSKVILVDMKLIGGLEVLKEIREHHPRLPVILVTGYRDDKAQAIGAALKISAYTYLYKPFQTEELLQLLTQIHHRELARVLGRPGYGGK